MSGADVQRIFFIRHGESQVTVDRVIGGFRTCTGLSELGRLQAEQLRRRLEESGEMRDARLIASSFARARETAELISPAFAVPEIVEDASFGEHDPGPMCDGMSFDAFTEQFGGPMDWDSLHGDVFPGGGETRAQFQLRVGGALHRLDTGAAGPELVICCHAGVIGAAFRELLGLAPTGGFDLEVRNTSITEFERVSARRWRLVRHNDAAHLTGLPRSTTVG